VLSLHSPAKFPPNIAPDVTVPCNSLQVYNEEDPLQSNVRTTRNFVVKMNCQLCLRRTVFDRTYIQPVLDDNKKNVKQYVYARRPICNSLIPNLAFIREAQLSIGSVPGDWFRDFVPKTLRIGNIVGFCMNQWVTFTNMVSKMNFAGQRKRGRGQRKCVDFTPREI